MPCSNGGLPSPAVREEEEEEEEESHLQVINFG
jgi:hypothetical protein